MSPEKTHELASIYPDLFSNLHPLEPFYLFGFECGDGWFELLKECITKIKEICERDKFKTKIVQVKEKYGCLRFYLDNYTNDIGTVVEDAEEKSKTICEYCGKEGKPVNRHRWYSAECAHCDKPNCA